MSDNALAMFSKDNLPDYLKDIALDETTKALMGGGMGGSRISIRGGVFRKIVNGTEVMKSDDRAMNVVVVKAAPHIARTYYEGTYSEDTKVAPTCWSSDGITPDADVKHAQSDACATCPMNISGSGQGDTKACRFSQRLAVVLDGDLEGDVMQLSLPAQSIFGAPEKGLMPMQSYSRFLGGHQVPIGAVITEMRFDTSSATPKLTFKPVRPLTAKEYEISKAQGATHEAEQAVTFTVSRQDGVDSDVGTQEDVDALKGAVKETAPEKATPAKPAARRTRRSKAEVEVERAAQAEEEKKSSAPAASADDDDDVDPMEAELLAKIAELKANKAKKAAEKAAAEAASAAQAETSVPASGASSVAAVLAEWGEDDDDSTDD